MGKIIVSLEDVVIQELALLKERTTIGRRSHNDVVINSPAISGDHAVIVTIVKDSFLEDLNSTNGTLVNGQPVKKHFLQNNDVIELAKYKIRFLVDARRPDLSEADKPISMKPILPAAEPEISRQASIQVLAGPGAGKEMQLTKAQTTLGRAGGQVAVINHTVQGYFLQHVEGAALPEVNEQTLGNQPHPLKNGDVIDLAGTHIRFSLR